MFSEGIPGIENTFFQSAMPLLNSPFLRTKPTAIDAATPAAVRLPRHRQPSPFISSGPNAITYVELLQHKKKTIGVTRNLTNSLKRMI